eukprot:970431-Rhodomonas_salina.1
MEATEVPGMLLRACYAVSGADLVRTSLLPGPPRMVESVSVTRTSVGAYAMRLRACYEMSVLSHTVTRCP